MTGTLRLLHKPPDEGDPQEIDGHERNQEPVPDKDECAKTLRLKKNLDEYCSGKKRKQIVKATFHAISSIGPILCDLQCIATDLEPISTDVESRCCSELWWAANPEMNLGA